MPTCTASGCKDVVTEHNAPSGTICVGPSTLVDVSSTDYCALEFNCKAGACEGSLWYAGCDGLGGCRPTHDHTDGHEQIIYADIGQTFHDTCCWDCHPWANSTSTDMTNLELTWKFETQAAFFPNTHFSFDSTCTNADDTGMIHATTWVK